MQKSTAGTFERNGSVTIHIDAGAIKKITESMKKVACAQNRLVSSAKCRDNIEDPSGDEPAKELFKFVRVDSA